MQVEGNTHLSRKEARDGGEIQSCCSISFFLQLVSLRVTNPDLVFLWSILGCVMVIRACSCRGWGEEDAGETVSFHL